jgi:alpha amylase-like protein
VTLGPWPAHPVIYEINAWVWLREQGLKAGRAITFAAVPAETWDELAELGVDAVWFMGVWERSPKGLGIAFGNAGLLADFRRALPDFAESDVVGSPYCVRRYEVDEHLGGAAGLAAARHALAARGMRLVLDFVPNHVAPDHPWVATHPEYFVRGNAQDLQRDPASFLEVSGQVIACGRDPFFPAWPDVVQLDAFAPGLRQAAAETLVAIAGQCDAVRCDMAMLLLNDVFARTWGGRVGTPPPTEYWPRVIGAVKAVHPAFRFVAEAYWDREWDLQQLGFDYCYDKRLYDRLEHGQTEAVRLHVSGDLAYHRRLVRFIENHDEPRAAATFGPEQARAAAVTFATLPGARLFHEGQLDGHRVRLPVFLSRRPQEPSDLSVRAFYGRLLHALAAPAVRHGTWRLLERTGWPDNPTTANLLAWSWEMDSERHVVIVNVSPQPAQGRIQFPWPELAGRRWLLRDAFTDQAYDRDGNVMLDPGLYVDLRPWDFHFFAVEGGRA